MMMMDETGGRSDGDSVVVHVLWGEETRLPEYSKGGRES